MTKKITKKLSELNEKEKQLILEGLIPVDESKKTKQIDPSKERDEYLNKTLTDIANSDLVDDEIFKLSNNILYGIDVPVSHRTLFNTDILGKDELVRVNQDYESYFDEYIEYLKDFDKQDLSQLNSSELKDKIKEFNTNYLKKYIYVISPNLIDLYDVNIRNREINLNTDRIVQLQIKAIKEYGVDEFLKLDLDNAKNPFIYYMELDLIKKAQKHINEGLKANDRYGIDYEQDNIIYTRDSINQMRDNYTNFYENDEDKNSDLNSLLYFSLYNYELAVYKDKIEQLYNDNKAKFDDRHKKYLLIDELTKQISNRFKELQDNIDLANGNLFLSKKPKEPKTKEMSLYATQIFNNSYKKGRFNIIDLHNHQYSLKMQIVVDEIEELRDIILYDEIKNEIVDLYPIDFALFSAFTSINTENKGNVPITLKDAIRYITEDKKYKFKKGNKQLQLYEDRLLLYNNAKVKVQIVKRTNEGKQFILFENKDLISILENKRVYINNRDDMGYIIGASAILTIINVLSKDSGINYLASYTTNKQYINDGQSNTIAILNMKHFIQPKILQQINQFKKGKQYQPKINLDKLYSATAKLTGKAELNSVEKGRLRDQMDIFINHLANKTGVQINTSYMSGNGKLITSKADSKGLTTPITHLVVSLDTKDE